MWLLFTIVAACINADTGVGPSIASGNHVCRPNWADFPIAPIKISIPIIVMVFISQPNRLIVEFVAYGTRLKIVA